MADQPLHALDEARAQAAWEDTYRSMTWPALPLTTRAAMILAARYGREGFEPLDPLLLKAREIAAEGAERVGHSVTTIRKIHEGEGDDEVLVQVALSALKQGLSMGRAEP